MSCKAKMQYLLTDTTSLPCTTQEDVTLADRQLIQYIHTACPFQKLEGSSFKKQEMSPLQHLTV